MKALFSLILSLIIFTASFQNSLFMIDYQINRAFYEIHCINKDKPEMDCHGKCQMKKESDKSSNPFNQVKYSFEFNILPAKPLEFNLNSATQLERKVEINTFYADFILPGFSEIFPHPPQFNVSFRA